MPNSQSFIQRPFTFDRVVRLLIVAAIAVGIFWLVNRLSSVLLPFLVAWLIAYLLEPMVQRNRRVLRTRGRLIPIIVTLLEVIMVFIVLCIILVPSILDETHQMAVLIKEYTASSQRIAFLPSQLHDFLVKYIDFNRISDSLTNENIRSIADLIGWFVSGGVSFIMSVFDWFLVLLYVVFIMLDYEKMIAGIHRMVPPRAGNIMFKILNDVKVSMNHYFRGQSLVALIVGILFSIGFLIVGIPMAVVLGLFIGLLNLVPYLQLVSIPITTLLCLIYSIRGGVEFWPTWWACMIVYVVVQCIQDLFLTPKIMGKAMGLNPALILFSLSLWGSLLGFIGLIIALPLTTLLMAYYNEYVVRRYKPSED